MTSSTGSIQEIVDRAASDPDFLTRLARNPGQTMQAEGYQVSPEEVKSLLAMPNASDEELAEALQERLSHCGGGGGAFSLSQVSP